MPLITNESGEKLGKSVGNALWLDDNLTTPYECYQVSVSFVLFEIILLTLFCLWYTQHFRNTPDSKVEEYLKIFTFLPINEIQQLMKVHQVSLKLIALLKAKF